MALNTTQWRRAGRQRDLPFDRDQSTRFLPWIVAPMVFLGMLSVASVIFIRDVTTSWDSQVAGSMTVQIPPVEGEQQTERVARATAFALATPEVEAAVPLDAAAARSMLEPWLGTAVEDLPVPEIIELTLEPNAVLDAQIFGSRLADIVAGAIVDDHRVWLDSLVNLAGLIMTLSLGALALIAVSAAASIIYATRSGLAVHRNIIDLLHHMGAQDDYIAKQFQRHVMTLCIRGGLIGSVMAALCLAALLYVGGDLDSTFFPALTLNIWQAALLMSVPVASVAAGIVTTRLTVLRALARLP